MDELFPDVRVERVAAEQGYLGSRWTLNKGCSGKKLGIRTTFCNGGDAEPDSWECGREDEGRDGIPTYRWLGRSSGCPRTTPPKE